ACDAPGGQVDQGGGLLEGIACPFPVDDGAVGEVVRVHVPAQHEAQEHEDAEAGADDDAEDGEEHRVTSLVHSCRTPPRRPRMGTWRSHVWGPTKIASAMTTALASMWRAGMPIL